MDWTPQYDLYFLPAVEVSVLVTDLFAIVRSFLDARNKQLCKIYTFIRVFRKLDDEVNFTAALAVTCISLSGIFLSADSPPPPPKNCANIKHS